MSQHAPCDLTLWVEVAPEVSWTFIRLHKAAKLLRSWYFVKTSAGFSVPGTVLSEALLELELELLSGPEAALLTLTDLLRQTPLGPVALVPSDASKAQRGMALWARANSKS